MPGSSSSSSSGSSVAVVPTTSVAEVNFVHGAGNYSYCLQRGAVAPKDENKTSIFATVAISNVMHLLNGFLSSQEIQYVLSDMTGKAVFAVKGTRSALAEYTCTWAACTFEASNAFENVENGQQAALIFTQGRQSLHTLLPAAPANETTSQTSEEGSRKRQSKDAPRDEDDTLSKILSSDATKEGMRRFLASRTYDVNLGAYISTTNGPTPVEVQALENAPKVPAFVTKATFVSNRKPKFLYKLTALGELAKNKVIEEQKEAEEESRKKKKKKRVGS
ncbi:unnamed protein product [Amoebophrya sp. A120]|nr:unnamed protein product [Amoebophrya sp. A120]|eukprot:GSA120T00011504001.1